MDKLQQIATTVGVSSNTVLRVLRGQNKEVWPSAARRANEIRKLAQKLGYLPNGSARSMRERRFNCVGLLLSDNRGRSHLPDGLFNRAHDALAEQGMRLVVSKLADEKLRSESIVPLLLRELSCDGLLINYTDHIPAEMRDLIRRYELPSIWINARQPADAVYFDDFGAAIALTQHLQAQGHKRIVYLDFVAHESSEEQHYSRLERYEGYAEAMRSKGMSPTPAAEFAGIPTDERLNATRALFASKNRPTAVISYDSGDRLLYAAALAGVRVPEDISLATFGPKRHEANARIVGGETFIGRRITTAMVPADVAAQEAVRMLLEKIEDPKRVFQPSVIPLEIDLGDTTGPVPK